MTTTTTSTGTAQPRIDGNYGEGPVAIGRAGALDLSQVWTEFMHYLYLPVRIPHSDPGLTAMPSTYRDGVTLPKALEFLARPVMDALADARATAPHLNDPYVYVTARRGFASPGNPVNRPGFHCDDFGGSDLNYIWSDRWPTRFVRSNQALTLPADDTESMRVMEMLGTSAEIETERWESQRTFNGNAERPALWMERGPACTLLRLSPYVIHDTPLIPEPGGMRSFFKISVSTQRYDLLGNSHNHELGYEWEMTRRAAQRNKPQSTALDTTGGTR